MNMDLLFCFGSITWTWPLGFLFVSQYLLVLLLLLFFFWSDKGMIKKIKEK